MLTDLTARTLTILFAFFAGHAFGHQHWDMAIFWILFSVLSLTNVRKATV